MPAGGWYVYNTQQVFDSIVTYLAVTGDTEFLHENCSGTQPLSLLKSLASSYQFWPHPLVDGQRIDLLADYGGNANYFDPNVVPSYNHVCASSQAGNVFMLEELATLLEQSDPQAAAAAKATAIRIANLTLGLYEHVAPTAMTAAWPLVSFIFFCIFCVTSFASSIFSK